MAGSVVRSAGQGLERSCGAGDWLASRPPVGGVELFRAHFGGRAFARHRHATYAIGVTEVGIQTFDYRGRVKTSRPGQVTVLHPDESHDGRPGSEDGFGYRIIYVEPERVADAVRSILGRPAPLPFVAEPVTDSPVLRQAVLAAFEHPPEPLAVDALLVRLGEGLLVSSGGPPGPGAALRLDRAALARARACLDSRHDIVRSDELELVSGLSRFELARQFRAWHGTSPYRYSLLRRLDYARDQLRAGRPLVEVALLAGFADQAHFTRLFTATYGVTPGRYARLQAAPVALVPIPAGDADAESRRGQRLEAADGAV